ncbi:hypothetical protein Q1695_004445 [Nippostrongylus brasiliensis]|nr:hypothetical protein Q1695_004445 [Nippostrongylus brasiliensis]
MLLAGSAWETERRREVSGREAIASFAVRVRVRLCLSVCLSIQKSTSTAATFSTLLSATTAKLAKPRTTPSFTVYPVRPTTPMGDLITTTMKASEAADFPRTALISIASVSVIMVIAVVVFCVFRCRQNPPPGDHYPMMNGNGYQSMKGAIITNGNGMNGHTKNGAGGGGGGGKKDFKECISKCPEAIPMPDLMFLFRTISIPIHSLIRFP